MELKVDNGPAILETPITWEILEADFQKTFASEAAIGPKRSLKLIGRGMGYVSKLILIEFDWTKDQDRLPKCAVVKITIDLPNLDPPSVDPTPHDPIILTEKMLHDTELLFYESSLDSSKVPSALKIPKFYCGRKYGVDGIDAGYIALEFIDGTVQRHIYHNISRNGVLEALDELVKLSVFSLQNADSLKQWPSNRFSIMSNVLAYCKFYDPSLETRLRRVEGKFSELSSEIKTIIEYLPKNFLDFENFMALRRSTCSMPILCQGDIWSPNILWKLDATGEYHVGGFVDWQLVQVGSPLEDLVFLFHSTLSVNDYTENINFYLEYYYDQLRTGFPSIRLPWIDVEELIKSYEISYAYMIPILLPLTVGMVDLEKSCSAEVIEECKHIWQEKIVLMAKESVRCLQKHLQK